MPRNDRVGSSDEAADHLHGATEELVAGGLTRVDAEREAVRRFGAEPTRSLARRAPQLPARRSSPSRCARSSCSARSDWSPIGLSGAVGGRHEPRLRRRIRRRHNRICPAASRIGRPRRRRTRCRCGCSPAWSGWPSLPARTWCVGAAGPRRRCCPPAPSTCSRSAAFGGAAAALGAASVDQLVAARRGRRRLLPERCRGGARLRAVRPASAPSARSPGRPVQRSWRPDPATRRRLRAHSRRVAARLPRSRRPRLISVPTPQVDITLSVY